MPSQKELNGPGEQGSFAQQPLHGAILVSPVQTRAALSWTPEKLLVTLGPSQVHLRGKAPHPQV